MFKLTQHESVIPDRVVVMGAGGFIGASALRKLTDDGANTLGLTRREVDLLSPDAALRLADRLKATDTLVFVSAIAPTRNPGQLADNVTMARAVCTTLEKIKVAHLLYVSSDAVYADSQNPITEISPLGSTSLHGAMHIAREAMAAATRLPLCILRPSVVYGANDPHDGYGPNRFRRLASAGQDINLFGGGEELRDHIAIEDVAALVSLCVRHKALGTLNVATGRSTSFRRVAELAVAQSGTSGRIVETPRQTPITHRHYDTAALIAAFPDFQFTPLAEGMERATRLAKELSSSS